MLDDVFLSLSNSRRRGVPKYKSIKHALVNRTVDKSSSLFMIKYFANKKHFLGGHYIFARALFAVLSIIGIISEFSVASL